MLRIWSICLKETGIFCWKGFLILLKLMCICFLGCYRSLISTLLHSTLLVKRTVLIRLAIFPLSLAFFFLNQFYITQIQNLPITSCSYSIFYFICQHVNIISDLCHFLSEFLDLTRSMPSVCYFTILVS